MGHIKRSHLAAAKCATPENSSSLLDEGAKLLNPLVEQIIKFELESRNLSQLRDILIPKLLSGDITVLDDLTQAEEVDGQ
jgi:type I restriction enzyme S subunit